MSVFRRALPMTIPLIFLQTAWLPHVSAESVSPGDDSRWFFAMGQSSDSRSSAIYGEEKGRKRDFGVYSYIAIGGEYILFSEKESRFGAETDSTTNGIAYLSGGLAFRIRDKYALSIQGGSTLYPGEGTEEWTRNGETIARNHFTVSSSNTRFFGHYFLTSRSQIITGPGFVLNTFTRSQFSGSAVDEITCGGDPGCITQEFLRVEQEQLFYVSWLVGYGYSRSPKTEGDYRLDASILAGLPVYKKVTNTRYPDTDFTDTNGYTLEGRFSLGYMIYPGLDIGLYLDYQITKFQSDKEQAFDVATGQETEAEIPENMTQILHYGLALEYSF